MGKVFTITEGLENLGALKTGGQGSVYKGRRNGTTITAVKLMPTPIYSESREDKNYIDFQNEVEKLRKVNESPNPHVVTILNSGITETGNFPFIEMEFIEGPDLEELLKPPHPPVFTIEETEKVASHIATALAHCHGVGVKHGDMKTNNIKLNTKTGNYVLLDFGLATMSDEQRRTSLRHAGAIEFMAPEQNEGQLLFQSDIYSFGIILFELLAGEVPFPLHDKSETARNTVMISHMETLPPDLLQLRQQKAYSIWDIDKREAEMEVPGWLLALIKRCLQKFPSNRFANGEELLQFIKDEQSRATVLGQPAIFQAPAVVAGAPKNVRETSPMNEAIMLEDVTFREERKVEQRKPFLLPLVLILAVVGLGAYGAYRFLGAERSEKIVSSTEADTAQIDTGLVAINTNEEEREPKIPVTKKVDTTASVKADEYEYDEEEVPRDSTIVAMPAVETDTAKATESNPPPKAKSSAGKYRVKSKAYFHNQPDESTRREAFIVHWNNATLNALEEKDGFIYVVFTNHMGQTSKGWLRTSDLTKVED
jgi:serine/threonine-protein kinase